MPAAKEYDNLTALKPGLDDEELSDLKQFAIDNQYDKGGNHRPVLQLRKDNDLHAQNYVGIITTRKGTVLEILPKVDLSSHENNEETKNEETKNEETKNEETKNEETKKIFLNMLRTWRGIGEEQFDQSNIRELRRFNMLEVFIRLFLDNLVTLTQRGLARHYHAEEENLPCLKGRLLFPQHLRINLANQSRFYVRFDEFSANQPANRLIHSTIRKLMPMVRQPQNRQLLYQLRPCFDQIPLSRQWQTDWDRYHIDRTMPHYDPVMPWIHLFLLGHGLTTFEGKHVNQSLLFPMEEVFEDFVTRHFRRCQNEFSVRAQGPPKYLAQLKGNVDAFKMKPDISLTSFDNPDDVYILDTKWKRINEYASYANRDISQDDMYQLYSYGKKYGCKKVALIYPRTDKFKAPFHYNFDDKLSLICFPFDVEDPKNSVCKIISSLKK